MVRQTRNFSCKILGIYSLIYRLREIMKNILGSWIFFFINLFIIHYLVVVTVYRNITEFSSPSFSITSKKKLTLQKKRPVTISVPHYHTATYQTRFFRDRTVYKFLVKIIQIKNKHIFHINLLPLLCSVRTPRN